MEPIEISSNSKELVRGFAKFTEYEPQIVGYTGKSYAGKIINGKPTFIENVELPENADIIIVIKAEKFKKTAFTAKSHTEEIEKRRAMVKLLKGCLAGYEINLDDIREERIAKRGLLE